VLLHNFFQSHLLMKLAVILNIYHKPHAITNSRTQSYRTQAHFVTGNLAAIMPYHGADTNRHTHTHTCYFNGVFMCVSGMLCGPSIGRRLAGLQEKCDCLWYKMKKKKMTTVVLQVFTQTNTHTSQVTIYIAVLTI